MNLRLIFAHVICLCGITSIAAASGDTKPFTEPNRSNDTKHVVVTSTHVVRFVAPGNGRLSMAPRELLGRLEDRGRGRLPTAMHQFDTPVGIAGRGDGPPQPTRMVGVTSVKAPKISGGQVTERGVLKVTLMPARN